MANIITAGNSTNGGTQINTDTSGTLNIVTGSGSGANAITIDASQAVTMPGTLAVTGAQTVGGNLTVTGTLTASGGVSGGIRSGTAVSATGTSIDFTSLPTGLKRITVMFNGISGSGTSNFLIQLGTSGGVQNTGYTSYSYNVAGPASASYTTGFGMVTFNSPAAFLFSGQMTLLLVDNSNNWVSTSILSSNGPSMSVGGGTKTALGGVLDRVRITTVNGTDTFDAGSINILFE